MSKIKIKKVQGNKKKKMYEVNYTLSTKEMLNQLQIDDNDGSNDIISNISEKIKPLLKESETKLTDTWKLTNTKDLINLKFLLELREE